MATRRKRCCAWRKRSTLAIDPNVRYWPFADIDLCSAQCPLSVARSLCPSDRLMAQDWTENLKPDEAQAALNALAAHQGAITVREAVGLQKLKKALQAKAEST
jgi:hypothetical protein